MFTVCSSASVCVSGVFMYLYFLSDHVETVTNKKKRRKYFYESALCSAADWVLLLPRRYRQPLMAGSEKPQSVHTLSDQSPPEETDADDRKHYSDVNVTEHDPDHHPGKYSKTNISCLFLSILGELAQDVVFQLSHVL